MERAVLHPTGGPSTAPGPPAPETVPGPHERLPGGPRLSPENRNRIADVLAHRAVRTVFQPIVDLGDGRVVGYEALTRGPAGPLERPDQLFAAARSAGLLAELDELCRSAAVAAAIRAGIHAPLTLFLNVEPEVLGLSSMDDLLRQAAAAPQELELVLEITERALAARPAELLATVRRLRAAGWRIALDDVGADNMSLAFMALLRPDIIKLDLALVQRRPGPDVAEIMHAVNAHAERTGCLVLAEGIENATHLHAARAFGARLGQGWKLGRPTAAPVPAGDRPGTQLGLRLPPAPFFPVASSPFACLPATLELRRSREPLLVEVSKHLERQAAHLGNTCVVIATFQDVRHVTARTLRRYRELAGQVAFVAAIGHGVPPSLARGVRGAALRPGDPVGSEWDVLVLAPHFAAALIAREVEPDAGAATADRIREFDFAVTYDRATVLMAAESLMARILPQ